VTPVFVKTLRRWNATCSPYTVARNATTQVATLTPNGPLLADQTYTAALSAALRSWPAAS
jgi:hypothetical protein